LQHTHLEGTYSTVSNDTSHGPAAAIAAATAWFEHHSGWAPPDAETLAELAADGLCRAPDDCLTRPDGWCEHGLASWALILDALA
jgi:hypothetical protein